jgi:hypothetical protein
MQTKTQSLPGSLEAKICLKANVLMHLEAFLRRKNEVEKEEEPRGAGAVSVYFMDTTNLQPAVN